MELRYEKDKIPSDELISNDDWSRLISKVAQESAPLHEKRIDESLIFSLVKSPLKASSEFLNSINLFNLPTIGRCKASFNFKTIFADC